MTVDEALDVLGKHFGWVDNVDQPNGFLMLHEPDELALDPEECEEIGLALVAIARSKGRLTLHVERPEPSAGPEGGTPL